MKPQSTINKIKWSCECVTVLRITLHQGSKFVVAMVANATMFSHLLPGCSCGSKHLLMYCHKFLVHAFLCNVCNAISYTTQDDRGSSDVEIQFTVLSSIFSLHKKCTYNFATTKLVLLPGLAPGSKSLLPPKK